MNSSSLAIQLYSLRREFGVDAEGTLRRIPALGFDSIELAGTYSWSVARWQQLLAETKLRIISAHTGLAALETDWENTVTFYRELGCTDLMISSIPGDLRHMAGYQYAAARLNVLGQRAKTEGLRLGYHNHAFEFEPLPGGTAGIDLLLAQTDPAVVKFEADTYWIERGGRDSRQFIEQHAGRIGWIHAKELRKSDNADVPAGQGDVDFKAILPAARQAGWPVIVEFEGDNAVASVTESARYLRSL